MSHTAVLIPGDGIGPEVAAAARRIVQAAGAPIHWIERFAGVAALDHGSDSVLPRETVASIEDCGVALKGPCGTPIGGSVSQPPRQSSNGILSGPIQDPVSCLSR